MSVKKKETPADWFIVINDKDEALAVYGSNLEDEARAKMKELLEQFKFGVRLVLTRMVRPSVHQMIPGKKVQRELLVYLDGQDPESKIHPNSLGRMRGLTTDGQRWAAYCNEAFDSSAFGHLKFLKVGAGCTYLEAPRPRMPDTARDINWAYQHKGVVDLMTGLIKKDGG